MCVWFPDCREEQYPCTRLYSVHKPCKQCLNSLCFYRYVPQGLKLFLNEHPTVKTQSLPPSQNLSEVCRTNKLWVICCNSIWAIENTSTTSPNAQVALHKQLVSVIDCKQRELKCIHQWGKYRSRYCLAKAGWRFYVGFYSVDIKTITVWLSCKSKSKDKDISSCQQISWLMPPNFSAALSPKPTGSSWSKVM